MSTDRKHGLFFGKLLAGNTPSSTVVECHGMCFNMTDMRCAPTMTIASLLLCSMPITGTLAQQTQTQFGLRLVIEPACASEAPARSSAARAALHPTDAVMIVSDYIEDGMSVSQSTGTFTVDQDHILPGNWLVSFSSGKSARSVFRVNKCTGLVTLVDQDG